MNSKMNFLQKLGLILVFLSCVILVGSEMLADYNYEETQRLVGQIKATLPDIREGDPGSYTDSAMPSFQLDEKDFCGLIQVPAFGVELPLGSSWDRNTVYQYPCRFWGSVYDHSLIIGGSNQKEQFDFCTKLDLGDSILVTDMRGAQFSYEVFQIDRRENADQQTLQAVDCDLVLFTRDNQSLDYIVVRCMFCP